MRKAELANRDHYATLGHMLNQWCARFVVLWQFFIGPGLTLPVLMLPWIIRSPKVRPLAYIGLGMIALNTLQLVGYPQHFSPITAIIFLFVTEGLRQLYVCATRRGFRSERVIAGLVLSVACSAAFTLWGEPLHIRPGTFWERPAWAYGEARAAILSKLEHLPGKHLVFVIYGANHSAHEDWVYNQADIDNSKVVWANSLGSGEDMKLRMYFKDRHAWIVLPDSDPNGFLPLTNKTYTEALQD